MLQRCGGAGQLTASLSTGMSSTLTRPIVLLVEDSEDDVFFFRYTLKKAAVPCSLFHAADGAQAIEYLRSGLESAGDPKRPWPDVVFLDLKLPTFSGFEVLAWLRERNPPPLDVTILSGSEHSSDVQRAKSLGATGYLTKPISVELLRLRLQRGAEAAATSSAPVAHTPSAVQRQA